MASILAGITVIFALAWCVAGLLHRASASTRHLVWTCAIAAALLLAPLRSPTSPAPTRTDPTRILLVLWAAGTIVLTLRLLRNAIQLRSIIRAASGNRPILRSSRLRGPLVAGLFNPVILLPESSENWSRVKSILDPQTNRSFPARLYPTRPSPQPTPT
jgi:beta-lactamase regulating signal transducer with metallopeptidase domain